MDPEPGRAISYGRGLGIAIVACAGCAVLSIFAVFIFLAANARHPPAWIGAVVLAPFPFVALGATLMVVRARRVARALAVQARARGWTWARRATNLQKARALPFRLSDGSVTQGAWQGVPFLAGEIGLGRGAANAVLVPMPSASPGLLVIPQALGRLARLQNPFVAPDIDFESAEFSRAYWVACADRRFAYDVLHPAMIDFLLSNRPVGALCWNGRVLACTFQGERISSAISPASLEQALPVAAGFRALIPRTLPTQAPVDPAPAAAGFAASDAQYARAARRAKRVLAGAGGAVGLAALALAVLHGHASGTLGGLVAALLFGGVIGLFVGGLMLAYASNDRLKRRSKLG